MEVTTLRFVDCKRSGNNALRYMVPQVFLRCWMKGISILIAARVPANDGRLGRIHSLDSSKLTLHKSVEAPRVVHASIFGFPADAPSLF